jgi:hypothetical protein
MADDLNFSLLCRATFSFSLNPVWAPPPLPSGEGWGEGNLALAGLLHTVTQLLPFLQSPDSGISPHPGPLPRGEGAKNRRYSEQFWKSDLAANGLPLLDHPPRHSRHGPQIGPRCRTTHLVTHGMGLKLTPVVGPPTPSLTASMPSVTFVHPCTSAATGILPPAAFVHPCTSAATGILPPAAFVHPCTSKKSPRSYSPRGQPSRASSARRTRFHA